MRRRAMPISWPRRDPRHYRFAMPNSVWEYKLKPIEFLIFSYLCYCNSTSTLTPETIATGVYMTAVTVKKYLNSLVAKNSSVKMVFLCSSARTRIFSLCPTRCFCCGFHPLRLWSTPTCC